MKRTIITLAVVVATTLPAFAQDLPGPVKARQGQFQIMAINLGILGAMAKGEVEYSAEAAQSAADSLVAVSMINQAPLWTEGTSEMDLEGTRAKAEIWDNLPDVLAKWSDFGTAATAIQASVGTGQEALGPALGQIGGTCKACHDEYRAPRN